MCCFAEKKIIIVGGAGDVEPPLPDSGRLEQLIEASRPSTPQSVCFVVVVIVCCHFIGFKKTLLSI
jgi:hypothetical protein